MAKTETDARKGGLERPFDPGTHLVLALECARPTEGSVRIRLDGTSEVRIGRGSRRHVEQQGAPGREGIEITAPDSRLSSDHARLVRAADGKGWRLEDRGSKNGTFLNGAPVAPGAPLADGDVYRCGQTLFVFRHEWPTEPGAPDVLESAGSSALATLVPTLARRFDEVARVAATDIPVLVFGETGTGKELMAEAVHSLSRRRGDLVTVNCGALPRQVVESVLFGHKKGAFSGAVADHLGVFRAAEGGTIVLDEIADLPLDVQVALLRVLQEGEVLPVGASRPVKIDVRVVAATNRDLEALVGAGGFREDLFARLAGFTLRLPPLRERREDLGLVIAALLRRIAPARPVSFASATGEALFAYPWPRNIRELEKCLARACALATSGLLEVEHLELPTATASAASPPPSPGAEPERNRARLVEALTMHKGNLVWVARALRTSRSQVHRWLKKYGLSPDDFRE